MTNMRTLDSRIWRCNAMTLSLAFAATAVTLLCARAAQAQTWYLMAADEKTVSEPRVSIRMEQGPVMGPLEFTSRAKFSSRAQCESARQKLIGEWRQRSAIKRGSWDKYGFTRPSVFIRCVPADDPQLKKSRASGHASRSIETFVNRPSRR
jgi:hypothetical protein